MDTNLKWDDITYYNSHTCQTMIHLTNEVNALYEKYKRLHDFDIYMTNTIQRLGVVTMEQYDQARAMLDHCPHMKVSEIFHELFWKKG